MFLHDFKKRADVFREFDVKDNNENILLACYTNEMYDGTAFVLFEKAGQLYEVNGSHCSCNGLENSWAPEETTLESLLYRLDNGTLGIDYFTKESVFAKELRELLNNYKFKEEFKKKIEE